MKTSSSQRSQSFMLNLAITLIVVAALSLIARPSAAATLGGTSANATIHNVVQVTYKFSAAMTALNVYETVDVTVLTVPTQATWYASGSQTVTGGSVASYTTTLLRSNANGPDAYTLSQSNGAATFADVQSAQAITTATPIWLWGGITTQAATAGVLYFPGASVEKDALHKLVTGNTIEITVGAVTKKYTVGVITPGNANTQAAGTASNEVMDQVAVTPVSGLPADQVGPANFVVPAGTQVGQYAAINFNVTTGYPTSTTNDGTNVTNLSALGAATNAAGDPETAATTSVTTIISKGVALLIVKTARVLPAATAPIGNGNLTPANYSATPPNVKTSQILEYHIVVTNPLGNADAQSVIITDPTPAYTTAVAGSQSEGTSAIGATPVAVTTTAGVNTRVWESAAKDFGALAAGNELHIVYQVTVN